MSRQVLVTGATGFIGTRLVEELIKRGHQVRAIVRETSDTSAIRALGCECFTADLLHPSNDIEAAVAGCDWVFHLAAETRSVVSRDLVQRNSRAMKSLLEAVAHQPEPARVVYVSSLAAAGPSSETQPLTESQPRRPVSWYGRSKAECEQLSESYSDRIPISIVRPPIVLGENDRNGWLMFQPIDQMGMHFVPGFRKRMFSAIYVGDLCEMLLEVAARGQSLTSDAPDGKSAQSGQGIYYATSPEVYSFAELGVAIGRAMGRRSVWAIPVAMPLLWAIAAFNELKARMVQRPQFLNRDKLHEAEAGSWWCSGKKMYDELGIAPHASFEDRLRTVVNGYRKAGWLSPAPSNRPTLGETASGKQSFG